MKKFEIPNEIDFLKIKDLAFFKNLTLDQITKIFSNSKTLIINSNDLLILEGEISDSLYIILDGECSIKIKDELYNKNHEISKISNGDIIGDMGLFGNKKREASVQATKETKLLQIMYNNFFELAENDNSYYKIFMNLSQTLIFRIKSGNLKNLENIQFNLKESIFKNKMANFFVFVICWLCLFSYLLKQLTIISQTSTSSSPASLLMLVICTIFVFVALNVLKMPMSKFGFNLNNWRKCILEGVLFSVPIIICIVVVKYILIQFNNHYAHNNLFDFWYHWKSTVLFNHLIPSIHVWLFTALLYIFLICFLQEFITRCVLQTLLAEFLSTKYKNILAIFISNLIFSTHHLHISYTIALGVFIPGFYFGWLYLRHKSIIGCLFAHIVIGFFSLYIIGIKGVS